MATAVHRFDPLALEGWTAALLGARGMPLQDARHVAVALVDADMRGITTHGLAQLKGYLALIEEGRSNVRPAISISGDQALLRVDADLALGPVAMERINDLLSDRARTIGIAAASVANVGHLGALGYVARRFAERGLVALVMQNGPAIMGLPGMTRRAIGNNPIAFASPVSGRPPLVLDTALSRVAYGKVVEAAQAGHTTLPEGWAMDAQGVPTVDAQSAPYGILQALGGAKGIGLAMMVEVLAGSLSGTRPAKGVGVFGAFLAVISPEATGDQAVFDAHMRAWIAHYEGSGAGARYPGLRSAQRHHAARQEGVALSDWLAKQLQDISHLEAVSMPDVLS